MRRSRTWRGAVRALTSILVVAAWGCLFWTPGAWGQEQQPALDAYLRAGEFGPALEAVRAMDDAGVRDRWLGKIAARQAELGARDASFHTLADMHSDLARRDAIQSLAEGPRGAGGGAAMADFDTLIELITSTIAPDSWDEAGGAGAIEPFPTGVYVDASGIMKRLAPRNDSTLLATAREAAAADSGNRSVRRTSALRKVSLVRLEKQLQLDRAFGRQPDDAMRLLAGLYQIKYLFVYPQTGDIVLAGPAGDWRTDTDGRVVNVETGTPVLQLDDLVVVLRNALEEQGKFGCTINPRQENLAATKSFQEAWQGRSIRPAQRSEWLSELRATLGQQDIKVWGIDARTRTARVLVEADYRMKLVGMGLEEGTLGVISYLDAVKRSGGDPPPMNVLRWWFTLNYEGVSATAARDAFELRGPGVQVLSENERISEAGQRVHTGVADELTSQFARSFTKHFDTLSAKYPLYAELKNVFDLALVMGLMVSHDLPGQVDWHMTYLGDPAGYPVTLGPLPQQVESVINSVTIKRNQFIAGVSGGVSVDTSALVKPEAVRVDDYGLMGADHAAAAPQRANLSRDAWWWD